MPDRGLEPLRVPDEFWHRDDVAAGLRDRDVGALFKLILRYTGASQTRGLLEARDLRATHEAMRRGA